MTLNSTGKISLGGLVTGESVNLELGVAAGTAISMPGSVRTLTGISSGPITLPTNFYGKSFRVSLSVTFSTDTVNASVSMTTAGLSGYVAGKTDLTITVNSGVNLWSNATASPALSIGGGTSGDTVTLVNNGNILGRGGDGLGGTIAANGVNSGGKALVFNIPATAAVYINNLGYIAGGGGGGAFASFGASGGGGAGGGRGGGNGGNGGGIPGAGGSGPGIAGSAGGIYIFAPYAYAGGGGGGYIVPGTGGAINAASGQSTGGSLGNGSGKAGGGGGAGGASGSVGGATAGAGGGANAAGGAGTGGTAAGGSATMVGAGGGGGGWGAAGGIASGSAVTGQIGNSAGTPVAGAGGAAVSRTGTITYISRGNIYGSG